MGEQLEQLASRLEMNEHWHPMIVTKEKTTTLRNWGLLRTAQFEQRVRDDKLVRLGQMMKPAICLIRIVSVQPRFRLWGMTKEDTRREGRGDRSDTLRIHRKVQRHVGGRVRHQ